MSFEEFHAANDALLLSEVDKICADFKVTSTQLYQLTYYFIDQMEVGLNREYIPEFQDEEEEEEDDSESGESGEGESRNNSNSNSRVRKDGNGVNGILDGIATGDSVDRRAIELSINQKLKNKGGGRSSTTATAQTRSNPGLPMIPSYVTGKPDGSEKGFALAASLGSSHFRICSIEFRGDRTYKIEQVKSSIPDDLKDEMATGRDLFSFVARRTKRFILKYHPDTLENGYVNPVKLGFTFSFPVDQHSLNSGTLIRWTKEIKIRDVIGRDVVQLYQEHLNRVGLPMVNVVALTNDTVGTFLSLCYTKGIRTNVNGERQRSFGDAGDISEPVIGCIFGSGTNGCYMEDVNNIKKLPAHVRDRLTHQGKGKMCINLEWGSFDNNLRFLPTTKYDILVDKKFSPTRGQAFEKRVSGLYLGEILRNIIIDLFEKGLILTQYRNYSMLPERLKQPFQLPTEILARIEIDDSHLLRETQLSLLQHLNVKTSLIERQIIQRLVREVSKRSAYLASVPISAILLKTKSLNRRYHGEVEVGYDGSLIECYPGFKSMLRDALALGPLGNDGERKIHLRYAKDGSGVGAALWALVS